jgi:hypothetical protein
MFLPGGFLVRFWPRKNEQNKYDLLKNSALLSVLVQE